MMDAAGAYKLVFVELSRLGLACNRHVRLGDTQPAPQVKKHLELASLSLILFTIAVNDILIIYRSLTKIKFERSCLAYVLYSSGVFL